MGTIREVAEEGGSGPNCLSKFLTRGGTVSATLWVGKLGVDGSDAEKLKGVHVSFMRQVTGMKAQKLGDENWQKEGAGGVIQEEGTKPLQDYINRRQVTVAEWVALRPIFKVCAKETGYEGGGDCVSSNGGVRRLQNGS